MSNLKLISFSFFSGAGKMSDSESSRSNTAEYFMSMGLEFNRMRKAAELTDVTLVFEGKKFPCHKLVPSKCDYFKVMFLSGWKESSTQEIEIHGVDSETGATLVDYFYEGEANIQRDNAARLLAAANMLLLKEFQETGEFSHQLHVFRYGENTLY
jgi:hypothetical protein